MAGRSGHRRPERAGAAAGVQVSSTRSRDLLTEGQRLTLNQCTFFFFLPRLEGNEPPQHWDDGSHASSFMPTWSREGSFAQESVLLVNPS